MTGLLIFLRVEVDCSFLEGCRVALCLKIKLKAVVPKLMQPRAIRVAGLGNFSASNPCN
jgi:hypothetical protein